MNAICKFCKKSLKNSMENLNVRPTEDLQEAIKNIFQLLVSKLYKNTVFFVLMNYFYYLLFTIDH